MINLEDFVSKIWGGILKISGNLVIDPMKFNAVFAYNNLDLTEFTKFLFEQNMIIPGRVSFNGRLYSKGESINELANNLDVEANYLASKIEINGIAIDDYIKTVLNPHYKFRASLKQDTYYAPYKGSTKFRSASGAAIIKDSLLHLKNNSFVTQFSTGALSAVLNIHNGDMKTISSILFLPLDKITYQEPIKLILHADNNFFNPRRWIDIEFLKQHLILLEKAKLEQQRSLNQNKRQHRH